MEATAKTSQICSEAKCKAVLASEIPGEKLFKTCEKGQNVDAAWRKRKQEEKDQGEGRAAPSPPTQDREGDLILALLKNANVGYLMQSPSHVYFKQ
jgi:hypothetical protein